MSYRTLLHIDHNLRIENYAVNFSFPLFTKKDLTYHLKDFLEPGSPIR